jgi:hypothetical protein
MSAPWNLLDRNHTPAICHPERSLAKSKDFRQTKSKDPGQLGKNLGDTRNFQAVVSFFHKHETRHLTISRREAVGM